MGMAGCGGIGFSMNTRFPYEYTGFSINTYRGIEIYSVFSINTCSGAFVLPTNRGGETLKKLPCPAPKNYNRNFIRIWLSRGIIFFTNFLCLILLSFLFFYFFSLYYFLFFISSLQQNNFYYTLCRYRKQYIILHRNRLDLWLSFSIFLYQNRRHL